MTVANAAFIPACHLTLCRFSRRTPRGAACTLIVLPYGLISQSDVAPELSAICRCELSGKVIDLLVRRCLPFGHPLASSGACAVVQNYQHHSGKTSDTLLFWVLQPLLGCGIIGVLIGLNRLWIEDGTVCQCLM